MIPRFARRRHCKADADVSLSAKGKSVTMFLHHHFMVVGEERGQHLLPAGLLRPATAVTHEETALGVPRAPSQAVDFSSEFLRHCK